MGPDIQKQRLLDLSSTVDDSSPVGTATITTPRIAAIRNVPTAPPRTPPRPSTMPTTLNKRPVVPARNPPSSSTSLPRSPSPVGSSVSSLHKASSDRKSESRQSVTSNSSVSSPPSPIADRLSSSYDS